ncbi:hypothetical protein K6112_06745 [Methylophilales bacterium]|nr:hypothetical protein K6112_06745 [Methylophilales bacterium]
MALSSLYVVPGYTFFYYGFTLQKAFYQEYIKHFGLSVSDRTKPIKLQIKNKVYDAKIRLVSQDNSGKSKKRSLVKYPERVVLHIFWNDELDTLKALRKLMIYSYASTRNKAKPKLKELLEFDHKDGNIFRLKTLSKQETDFDEMFYFLEDKNLFAFWEDSKNKKPKDKLFISYSDRWLDKSELKKYASRSNVVYILNNKNESQIYVGKANSFGNRVNDKSTRVAMDEFDSFLFFELHPEYSFLLDEVENYSIRLFATIFSNMVNVKGLNLNNMRLVNKQIKK